LYLYISLKQLPLQFLLLYIFLSLCCTHQALHFGGYEFFRNSILALFTSSEFGFSHAAAYPLANGLISPFSLLLLWGYGQQLGRQGPRVALYNTTLGSILFIAVSCLTLQLSSLAGATVVVPKVVHQAIIGVTFLFQSSYQYLLYTQQWSFVGSVLTPQEGATWFATLAGCSSLLSSLCGAVIPYMLPYTGLLGLMSTTCITLTLCLWCSDRAYSLAQQHGFDPTAANNPKEKMNEKETKDKDNSNKKTGSVGSGSTFRLFRRVPTLAALMLEVLTFQSLNTILNVAFVRATRLEIPNDMLRSAYTSRFFSYINAVSATLQFLILPTFMKYTEPGTYPNFFARVLGASLVDVVVVAVACSISCSLISLLAYTLYYSYLACLTNSMGMACNARDSLCRLLVPDYCLFDYRDIEFDTIGGGLFPVQDNGLLLAVGCFCHGLSTLGL
jgi:hypothetical protein